MSGINHKFMRRIVEVRRTVKVLDRPVWYSGSSNRKAVTLEQVLECGHTVTRRAGNHPGSKYTRCEWCESGEQQGEVA